jgi:hypothetical protein
LFRLMALLWRGDLFSLAVHYLLFCHAAVCMADAAQSPAGRSLRRVVCFPTRRYVYVASSFVCARYMLPIGRTDSDARPGGVKAAAWRCCRMICININIIRGDNVSIQQRWSVTVIAPVVVL